MIKEKVKYIVLYGGSCWDQEIYTLCETMREAKQAIIDCIHENDCHIDDIQCLEVRDRHIETKIKVKIEG